MMSRPHPRSSRAGFSLIELLIVITVIAILAALIAAAVIRAQVVGERTQAVAEINQLAAAASAFKTAYGFYPPDKPMDVATALQKMYPRYTMPFPTPALTDGNQCLVYFLGGPNGTGWDPATPAAPTGTSKKGPFFDFPAGPRLEGTPARFLDPWGTPYAYFRYSGTGYSGSQTYTNNKEGWSANTISPFSAGGKPVNIDGVQVISAGPDAKFGAGGATVGSATGDGADDLGNFNGGVQLGTNPN